MILKRRIAEDIFGILSEVGGLLKILQMIFNVISYPISNYLFILIIIKRLLFAKTQEENVFLKD